MSATRSSRCTRAALFYAGVPARRRSSPGASAASVPLTHLSDEDALGLWSRSRSTPGATGPRSTPGRPSAGRRGDAGRSRRRRPRGAHPAVGSLFQSRFVEASRWLAEAERQFEHVFDVLAGTRAVALVGGAMGAPDVETAFERCLAALGGNEPMANQLPARPHPGRGLDALGRRRHERAQAILLDAAEHDRDAARTRDS